MGTLPAVELAAVFTSLDAAKLRKVHTNFASVQFGTFRTGRNAYVRIVGRFDTRISLQHGDRFVSARDTTPGELWWSVRKPDGATLTCELLDQGQLGVEIKLARDGQFLLGRRFPDRSSAVVRADDLKTQHIRDGAVVVRDAGMERTA
jgi:hypothetical protein